MVPYQLMLLGKFVSHIYIIYPQVRRDDEFLRRFKTFWLLYLLLISNRSFSFENMRLVRPERETETEEEFTCLYRTSFYTESPRPERSFSS